MIMKSIYAHLRSGKMLEKWTYTQSYPHYPQKKGKFTIKNGDKNRKYVLLILLKKNLLKKRIDKSNVEKCCENF